MANLIRRNNPDPLGFSGFFNDFANDFFTDSLFQRMPVPYPADLRRDNDKLIFEMEAPGVKKEDVAVFLQEGRLSVSWTRKGQKLSRTEYVGKVVDPVARLEDGMLRITMRVPDAERIEVKVE